MWERARAAVVVGIAVTSALSCVGGVPTRNSGGSATLEDEVRAFIGRLDTAIVDQNWELVESAFADDVVISFYFPPRGPDRISITKSELLHSLQTDAAKQAYARTRSIKTVVVNAYSTLATVQSVVDETHLDEEKRTVVAWFVDTTEVRVGSGPMEIVKYVFVIPDIARVQ